MLNLHWTGCFQPNLGATIKGVRTCKNNVQTYTVFCQTYCQVRIARKACGRGASFWASCCSYHECRLARIRLSWDINTRTARKHTLAIPNKGLANWGYCGWFRNPAPRNETMGKPERLLVFTWESSFQGFSGGAKWSSFIHSSSHSLNKDPYIIHLNIALSMVGLFWFKWAKCIL